MKQQKVAKNKILDTDAIMKRLENLKNLFRDDETLWKHIEQSILESLEKGRENDKE